MKESIYVGCWDDQMGNIMVAEERQHPINYKCEILKNVSYINGVFYFSRKSWEISANMMIIYIKYKYWREEGDVDIYLIPDKLKNGCSGPCE